MRLISWNVNGLRAVVQKGFEDAFYGLDADAFCVQETKLQEGQIDLDLPGYYQYWSYAEKKGYSGTAVFTKMKPLSVSYNLGIPEHDTEGRAVTLEFEDFYLVCVYTPNSQEGLKRLDYRMNWEDDFRAYVCTLDENKPVIICGDMNVAHEEIDLKNPKANRGNAGFSDEERAKFTELLETGFTDTFRFLYPETEGAYSWWSFRSNAREKGIGWRIDYFLASDRLRENLDKAFICPEIYGSDHCPVGLDIHFQETVMVKIGNVEIDGLLALAPMAGVTDIAFREICRAQGAAYTSTEMVSAKALVYNDVKTKSLLEIGQNEHPCAAQIFGSEPEFMEQAAGLARELSGADVIDINMGCPVGKVAGNGDGSALMRDPDKARRVIEAVIRGAGVPVTVKFRKGWDKGHVNAIEFGKMCEEAGASAIAVHGRTRTQMYSGVADWDIIRDVKKAVSIPVFANGDVFEPEDAPRILRYTGCDMVMMGRGAFGNPWLFSRANALLRGEPLPELPPLAERIDTAVRQFERAAEFKGEKIACLEARRHFAWYLHGVPHSGYFKTQVVRVETLEDIYRLAKQINTSLR